MPLRKPSIEKRLATLETAHRVLAAKEHALRQYSKVIFALTGAPHAMVGHLLTTTRETTRRHMTAKGWDRHFQGLVMEAMDELQEVLEAAHSASGKRPAAENGG